MEKAEGLDCVFIGSDQVFNPRVNGHDPVFFGEGIAEVTRLASYAASLGDATADSITACDGAVVDRLSSFAGLSVREQSSMAVLRDMGLNAVFMPDPTLLLPSETWSRFASIDGLDSVPDACVLLYTLNSEQKLIDQSREVAERLGVPVVCVHYNTKKIDGAINLRGIGPGSFLELVKRAVFICTDSFHGACFSLDFNKPFIVKTSESTVQSNVRITDLLARYGLENCLYGDRTIEMPKVDFGHANMTLENDREMARSFIIDCIGS